MELYNPSASCGRQTGTCMELHNPSAPCGRQTGICMETKFLLGRRPIEVGRGERAARRPSEPCVNVEPTGSSRWFHLLPLHFHSSATDRLTDRRGSGDRVIHARLPGCRDAALEGWKVGRKRSACRLPYLSTFPPLPVDHPLSFTRRWGGGEVKTWKGGKRQRRACCLAGRSAQLRRLQKTYAGLLARLLIDSRTARPGAGRVAAGVEKASRRAAARRRGGGRR